MRFRWIQEPYKHKWWLIGLQSHEKNWVKHSFPTFLRSFLRIFLLFKFLYLDYSPKFISRRLRIFWGSPADILFSSLFQIQFSAACGYFEDLLRISYFSSLIQIQLSAVCGYFEDFLRISYFSYLFQIQFSAACGYFEDFLRKFDFPWHIK